MTMIKKLLLTVATTLTIVAGVGSVLNGPAYAMQVNGTASSKVTNKIGKSQTTNAIIGKIGKSQITQTVNKIGKTHKIAK